MLGNSQNPIDHSVHSAFDIRHEMLCGEKILLISTNLRDFLRTVWPVDVSQISFWVDAVCINQSDLAERAMQVSIMRYI